MKMAVTNQQLKKLCQKGKYKDDAKVIEDLQRVFSRYTHLKISTDKYTYEDGCVKTLLNLFGTVPVCYQGSNYNVPVRLWLQRTHPEDAPICYVEPTNDMYVAQSHNVDAAGKIYLPYLSQWRWPTFDTAGLLSVIITVFSEKMPVYAKTTGMNFQNIASQQAARRGSSLSIASTSSDSSDYAMSLSDSQPFLAHAESCKQFLHKAVKNYKNKDEVKRDMFEALAEHRHLKPQLEDWEDTDGKMKKTLNLSGTVGINYQGGSYNIPICIWILRNYPESLPLCYVRPTRDMAIKASALVDPAGKIMLPYLQHWKHPNTDLDGLLQVIAVEFGKDCPIYSVTSAQNSNVAQDGRRGSAASITSTNYMSPSSRPVAQGQGSDYLVPQSQPPHYMSPQNQPPHYMSPQGQRSQGQPPHYMSPEGQGSHYMSAASQQGVYMPLGPRQSEQYMTMHAVAPGAAQQHGPGSYYNLGNPAGIPEHKPATPPTTRTQHMANRPLPPVPAQPAAQGTPPTARSQGQLNPIQEDSQSADENRKLQEQLEQARRELELFRLREKTRELEEAQMCSICMEKRKDMAFQCGHMTCRDCSTQLQNCPICRNPIERKIGLYQC